VAAERAARYQAQYGAAAAEPAGGAGGGGGGGTAAAWDWRDLDLSLLGEPVRVPGLQIEVPLWALLLALVAVVGAGPASLACVPAPDARFGSAAPFGES
jgi:hypothetical protein